MKTFAAVLTQLGAPLELFELEIPPLKRGQVLVHLAYSGICRTQINEIRGLKGPDPYLPHTLGHEGSGHVVDCGEGVTKVKPGDAVVATWLKGEGLDAPQTIYSSKRGNVNSGAISTFSEYAVIAENRLIPIPASFPMESAALFGCAIPTGAGIVYNDLKIPQGATVAVFGTGGIGASALLAARSKKPALLIAIDRDDAKLALARALGATHTIHAEREDPLEKILAWTEKKGVDFAIEAVGKKAVMELAFRSVRDKGGACILAGNAPKGELVACDPFDFIKGKRLLGSWGGGGNPDVDIPKFLRKFGQKKMLEPLISETLPLSQINEAIEKMETQSKARLLLCCRECHE